MVTGLLRTEGVPGMLAEQDGMVTYFLRFLESHWDWQG